MSTSPIKNPIIELFGIPTQNPPREWNAILSEQACPYLNRKCLKVRKSQSDISIGTCTVTHGIKQPRDVIICPHRFLERQQIFLDCLHLLALHEPGNEIHCLSEIEIPGGSVDYFLASVRQGTIIDFVGIELQALDTTGSLWEARQALIENQPVPSLTYGINWKMTAKTTLIQLHHKVQTFEGLGKHLVLVLQSDLMTYMQTEFNFAQIKEAKQGHAMHFHAYDIFPDQTHQYQLSLTSRNSTDAAGIAASLGLQANTNVDLQKLLNTLSKKISPQTRLKPF